MDLNKKNMKNLMILIVFAVYSRRCNGIYSEYTNAFSGRKSVR